MIDDPEPHPRTRRPPAPPGPSDPPATSAAPSGPASGPSGAWDPGPLGEVTGPAPAPGWGVVVDPGGDPEPHSSAAGPEPDHGPESGSDARPPLHRLLRPWFEPRPGELRGAIVLLSVALAVSLALWFDASRRPTSERPPVPPDAALVEGDAPGALAGGSADGSDGWGLPGPTVAPGTVVHVSGAVRTPGVVMLPPSSRVADAIEAAGGAMPDAATDRINLARFVEDAERVHVPRVGEDAPPPEGPGSQGVLPDGRIDLNAASQAELETLPGVGPARAQAIIAEREERPFRAPGDLRRVPGIGEATFQRLAPLVAVR